MAIVQVTIVPLGTAGTSLSPYVAEIHKFLKDAPAKSTLTPMGTVLEGALGEIFDVIEKMHEIPFDRGAARVMTLINVDDRRDKDSSAQGKMDSVLNKLK